ncbi:MAG: (Fe-S)-binding protein [Planctomycetaceae bacterium]|nr:(Fe-S)-binding protein [Planctomycetaceae bacterium]
MNEEPVASTAASHLEKLTSCVHCGFCLEVCPTYQLTGDENNSPRGRLRLWREEADGRLGLDPWTVQYTNECVGCLACETSCPANVPYGDILEVVRHQHVETNRNRLSPSLRMAAFVAKHQWLLNLTSLPIRFLRRWSPIGIPLGLRSPFWMAARSALALSGAPATLMSTHAYADRLMKRHRPTGPRVALFTGCLMESVFREINFATVRVLIENNIQVIVPSSQTCCGAMHEHLGLSHPESLRDLNSRFFSGTHVDVVLTNSSGCGLALSKTPGIPPVVDVLEYLGRHSIRKRLNRPPESRVFLDLPCHLVHGQRLDLIPESVMDATGYQWNLAPMSRECCGSGGTYHLQKPENSEQILSRKSEFLNQAPGDPLILATSNHVCMMQWQSAALKNMVRRPFLVQHVIQLLDPGPAFGE